MDSALIATAFGALASTFATVNPVLAQVAKILAAMFASWPAIETGIATYAPYLDAIKSIISGGALPADEFDKLIAALNAQDAVLKTQVDADTATKASRAAAKKGN